MGAIQVGGAPPAILTTPLSLVDGDVVEREGAAGDVHVAVAHVEEGGVAALEFVDAGVVTLGGTQMLGRLEVGLAVLTVRMPAGH